MSKLRVPASIASLYNNSKTTEEKTKLLRHYKEWQEGMFAKAHYDYLVKEYEKAIQEYVESSWITRFMQRSFIAENKAKLALLKKLQSTFKCEDV